MRFGQLVSQVGERVRFAVLSRPECRVHRGPQIRCVKPRGNQRGVQAGDLNEQVRNIGDGLGYGNLTPGAGPYLGKVVQPRADRVGIGMQRQRPGSLGALVQGAPPFLQPTRRRAGGRIAGAS